MVKQKTEERRRCNWTAHTKHTLPFNSNDTTQDRAKARKASTDEGKSAQVRKRVSMMGKAPGA